MYFIVVSHVFFCFKLTDQTRNSTEGLIPAPHSISYHTPRHHTGPIYFVHMVLGLASGILYLVYQTRTCSMLAALNYGEVSSSSQDHQGAQSANRPRSIITSEAEGQYI